MHDMFDVLYDDIFLSNKDDNKEKVQEDVKEEKHNDIKTKYIDVINMYMKSGVSIENKRFLIGLRREYLKIQGIKDYNNVQKKLYSNMDSNNILRFELERILRHNNLDAKIKEQANDMIRLINLYPTQIPTSLYNKIVYLIIRIEIVLDIKIGLFNELCSFYEKEMESISEQFNINEDGLSKIKKV